MSDEIERKANLIMLCIVAAFLCFCWLYFRRNLGESISNGAYKQGAKE